MVELEAVFPHPVGQVAVRPAERQDTRVAKNGAVVESKMGIRAPEGVSGDEVHEGRGPIARHDVASGRRTRFVHGND